MAHLTLPKPKKRKYKDFEYNRKERQKIYNTKRWRDLRQNKLAADPLCEKCLLKNKTTPAQEVHHIVSFMLVPQGVDRNRLAYDFNNLMSLCSKCHRAIHGRKNSID